MDKNIALGLVDNGSTKIETPGIQYSVKLPPPVAVLKMSE